MRKLEDTIALLIEIRANLTSDLGIAALKQVLNSKYSIALSQFSEGLWQ